MSSEENQTHCHHEHHHCHCDHHQCGCQHSDLDELHHEHGFEVIFEGEIETTCHQVWNQLLQANSWIPNVVFTDQKPAGHLTYQGENLNDEYMIMDFEIEKLISFSWLEQSIVTIELDEQVNQTLIRMNIWLPEITENTLDLLKDWVINLKRLDTLLNQQEFNLFVEEEQIIHQDVEALILNLKETEI